MLFAACAHDPAAERPAPCPYEWAHDGTQSYEILCREPVTNRAKVKHVLITTKARSYEEAQALARNVLDQLRQGQPIEPLMKQHSEDPGSAETGIFYEVTPGAGLASEFKSLSLRLNPREAGIVKSSFGLHVIQRVE